ncbi:MAG: hypothetical protein R3A52_19740 [Polyangiales bacterium]
MAFGGSRRLAVLTTVDARAQPHAINADPGDPRSATRRPRGRALRAPSTPPRPTAT